MHSFNIRKSRMSVEEPYLVLLCSVFRDHWYSKKVPGLSKTVGCQIHKTRSEDKTEHQSAVREI